MRKVKSSLSLFSLLLAGCIFASSPIPIKIDRKNNSSTSHRDRAPLRVSLDVSYEPEEQIIEVNCDNWDGEVYLYNSSNTVVDYSPMINCTFSIAKQPSSTYFIVITTETWEATGVITK